MSVNTPNNKLGLYAPEFNLISTDDRYYQFKDILGENGTLVVFICNHCPYVIKIIDRLVYEAGELKKINISTVAIMSNDVTSYPQDSPNNMKLFSKKYNLNFPYLFDETQNIAKSYNAVCTPDFFGFNRNKILQYRGRIDSGVDESNKKIKRELFYAMELISKTNNGPDKQYNSFGCSIKWV